MGCSTKRHPLHRRSAASGSPRKRLKMKCSSRVKCSSAHPEKFARPSPQPDSQPPLPNGLQTLMGSLEAPLGTVNNVIESYVLNECHSFENTHVCLRVSS